MEIKSSIAKHLPLSFEIIGATIGLATENYWWFMIAAIAGVYDLYNHSKKSK